VKAATIGIRTLVDYSVWLKDRQQIAPNMVSSPPIVSNVFHSASLIYSRVEESSANTPTSSTNRSDIDNGSDTKLTIEDLSVEYRQKFKAINLKME
jgi:hypothetical protein